MQLEQLLQKLQAFAGHGTSQSWRKDTEFNYENEYICLMRVDSSNVAGGAGVSKGKQWSFYYRPEKELPKSAKMEIA